jgi:hypothetical protein
MNQLDQCLLSEIKVLDNWVTAPLGSLLQIPLRVEYRNPATGELIVVPEVVGMRTAFKTANGSVDGVVIISGTHVGRLETSANLHGRPALDVSGLLELVAIVPKVFAAHPADFEPGMLFRWRGGDFVRFTMLSGSGNGFVCVNHSDANQIGQQIDQFLSRDAVGIAESIGVQPRPRPIPVHAPPASQAA